MNVATTAIWHALGMSFAMFWEILWALILGFGISAIVQAVVTKSEMARLLPNASVTSLFKASVLGAASSSCSYAAVAIARSLFRKGANFTAAIVFEFASTNLVVELGVILAVLMAWQFVLAEYVGGFIMIAILAVLFRYFLKPSLVEEAREQANKGISGKMEGHADMDMSVDGANVWQRIFSRKGLTAISHYFVMDWASLWTDIVLGLLIAGALAAWVPQTFLQHFFFGANPKAAFLWGPLVGPLVSVISFVCSIGNVPLAAVLWRGGISFGGVVSFIFADLVVIPVLNIYHKYYGGRMTAFLFFTSYAAMAGAGYVTELLFRLLHLIPNRHAIVLEPHVTLNYTSILNILFLVLAGGLVARFLRTGGPEMLSMMDKPAAEDHSHHH